MSAEGDQCGRAAQGFKIVGYRGDKAISVSFLAKRPDSLGILASYNPIYVVDVSKFNSSTSLGVGDYCINKY